MNNSHCKRKIRPLLGIGLVAALLGAACDLREVTAPTPAIAPEGGARLNTAAAGLGSSFLSAPATSHPNDVASPPFQGFSPAPAGTWIIVRTSGQVSSEFNPECGRAATPYWQCGTGNQLSPFASAFPSTVGPVQVVLQRGTNETPIELRASGGGAVGLFYSSSGGTLAGRVMMAANFWYEPGYNYVPAFYFSGGYQISAEAVPPPLEVSETGGGANGARTYSVVPLYGLQLVNPADPYYFQYWPAGAVTWTFIRGESVSDDPGIPGAQSIPVNECGFQLTCTYTPPGPGRMQATAWVESRAVTVRSSGGAPADTLGLTCGGAQDSLRITRADEVSCQVTGTTEVVGWDFVAEGAPYRNPANGGTSFKGLEWKGKIVLSGTVAVRARMGVDTVSKSVRVVVEAREWGGMTILRRISEEPATDLPLRPDSLHDLGHIHQRLELEMARDEWEPILSGPNANLAYLVKVPVEYVGSVHVNRAALSVGSDFWNAQYTRQRTSGVVDCLQREADLTGFIPVILRHEGIGFDPKSHAFLYVNEAERAGNAGFEQVVGSTLDELLDESDVVRAAAQSAARTATLRADSTGYRPQWCRFHFNY